MLKSISLIVRLILNKFPRFFSNFIGFGLFGRKIKIDVIKTLEKKFPKGSDFIFIQIGANDGITFDFIYDFIKDLNVSGILVEPSPKYFPKLEENFKDVKGIHLVSKAIYSKNEFINLYELNEVGLKKLPEWGAGLGSLKKEHLLKHNISSDNLITYQVEGITFKTLMNLYPGFNSINYLLIDTEGYDFEILKSINFDEFNADIIQFEIFNLTDKDKIDSKKLMQKNGYFSYSMNIDLFCVKNKSDLYLRF